MHSLASTRPRRTVSGPAGGQYHWRAYGLQRRLVMPRILNHRTNVAVSIGRTCAARRVDLFRSQFADGCRADRHRFAYVAGAIAVTAELGVPQTGIDLLVDLVFPMVLGIFISGIWRGAGGARYAQRTTSRCRCRRWWHGWRSRSNASRPCGIMDHMVSATGSAASAMHLDCRDLSYDLYALPAGYAFLVIHSGSGRKLSEGI